MKNTVRIIACIFLLLSGCAKAPIHQLQNKTFLEGHEELYPLIGPASSVTFYELDGKKLGDFLKGYPWQINIQPGLHEVKVKCSATMGTNYSDGEEVFKMIFEKDRQYQFVMEIHPEHKCSIKVTEL